MMGRERAGCAEREVELSLNSSTTSSAMLLCWDHKPSDRTRSSGPYGRLEGCELISPQEVRFPKGRSHSRKGLSAGPHQPEFLDWWESLLCQCRDRSVQMGWDGASSNLNFVMHGFKGNQHLELHLKAIWQPGQVAEQRCNIGYPRCFKNYPCCHTLHQLKFLNALHVECIAVVQTQDDQGLNDWVQGFLI